MNLIRVFILLYIAITPILLIGVIYLSVRTRNILESRIWLKKYFLPMFLLLILSIFNIGLFNRLFPSIISKTEILCVSSGDVSSDIEYPMNQSFIGLIEIDDLDYIEYADVFHPSIIGYTNRLYYQFHVVNVYKGFTDDGLLYVSENQPAFLMDEFPCSQLAYQERLSKGIYFVYMDERVQALPYKDQWYDEAQNLLSYQLIENYDEDVSYDLQDQAVKDQITSILSHLPNE